MKDLIIPEFGMTTEEVTIGEWLKAVGDPIDAASRSPN